jgi:hypothetical protein
MAIPTACENTPAFQYESQNVRTEVGAQWENWDVPCNLNAQWKWLPERMADSLTEWLSNRKPDSLNQYLDLSSWLDCRVNPTDVIDRFTGLIAWPSERVREWGKEWMTGLSEWLKAMTFQTGLTDDLAELLVTLIFGGGLLRLRASAYPRQLVGPM